MNDEEQSSDWFNSYEEAFESARQLALEHNVAVAFERLDGRFGRDVTTTKWRLNYVVKRPTPELDDDDADDIYLYHWFGVDSEIESCPDSYIRPLKHDPFRPKSKQLFVRFFERFREALRIAKTTSRQLGTHVQIERDGEELWYIAWMQETTGRGETEGTPPDGYFSWDHYYDSIADENS